MWQRITPAHSQFLNILRACAAYAVLISHLYKAYIFRKLPFFHPFYFIVDALAAYAVMLFFILSGFLITYSILNITQRNQNYFNTSEYLKLRLLRLHPPLVFSLLLTLLITFIILKFKLFGSISYFLPGDLNPIIEKINFNLGDYIASFFYLQGVFIGAPPTANLPLWSLSYEFWYYLFAMFIAMAVINKKWFLGFFGLLFFSFSIFYLQNYHMLILFSVWLAGAGLACLYATKLLFTFFGKILLWTGLVLSLSITFLALNDQGWAYLYPYTDFPHHQISTWILALISITMACIIGLFLHKTYFSQNQAGIPDKKTKNFLANGAPYSYTLYMIHYPLLLLSLSLLGPYITWMSIPLLTITIIPLFFVGIVFLAKYLAYFLENRTWIEKTARRKFW
jgi:peptidoglycan/LPS O-acetylase OafA/YrhL